jgi:hypothetical protein
VIWSIGILVGANHLISSVPLAYHSQRSPAATTGETRTAHAERVGAP